VNFLFRLFIKYFKELLQYKFIEKHRIKIQILGNWQEAVPPKLKEVLNKIILKTSKYNKYHLTFLLNYDGRDDVLHAIKKLQKEPPEKIDIKTVQDNLITSILPPVDLVIRTGGEPHNSAGFLMWQTAYSQYYFTDIFLPAFNKTEFKKALNNYFMRQRRFGK
jgi:undecaprenyl diphosphate synthase